MDVSQIAFIEIFKNCTGLIFRYSSDMAERIQTLEMVIEEEPINRQSSCLLIMKKFQELVFQLQRF
jgi:hypothetical protein